MSARSEHHRSRADGGSRAANADLFAGTPWAIGQQLESKGTTKRPITPKLRVLCPADFNEMLSGVEEILLRIQRHPGLHMYVLKDSFLDRHLVLVRASNSRMDQEAQDLLLAVQDPNRYSWMPSSNEHGERGALVDTPQSSRRFNLMSCISKQGGSVVLEMLPNRSLVRHAGLSAQWQVQALLARVRANTSIAIVPTISPTISSPVDVANPGDVNAMADEWQQLMKALKREIDDLGAKP